MEGIPPSSRGPQTETSPLVYHEMQNGYSERHPFMAAQHMNHSQSPLSVRTNYAPTTPHFKVQMWQQPIFDSGVQSMQHSQSASVMSFPAGSEMSAMSMMDQGELTDIQQQKFDCIPVSSTAIPQLLQLMREGDEVEICRALSVIQNIAKLDPRDNHEANIQTSEVISVITSYLREKSSEKIIRAAVSALFHICSREIGLSLLLSSVEHGDGEIVRLITSNIEKQNPCINKYAILTLHSLLSDQMKRHKCLQLARKFDALRNITITLQREQSEKLLSVAVDILRILCEDNREKQAEFIKLNGIPILLNILARQQYENLLRGTTVVLKLLSNSFSRELVEHQVPAVLSKQLKHSSQRLVLCSLEALRNLSDVPSREHNQTKILENLIRLLGCANSRIMLYTVQILGNMSANNETNKVFLESHDIVRFLLVMLRNNCPMNGYERNTMKVEELNEAVLSTLRQLCCGHPKAEKVQKNVFQEPQIFFDLLKSMRPVLLKQTLKLLNRLTNHNDNLQNFKTFRALNDQNVCVGFVEQVVHILRISSYQIIENNIAIEGVHVSELVTLCLLILESLCRDRFIFGETVNLLKSHSQEFQEPVFLPMFLLQQNIINNFSMKEASLKLTLVLISHPDINSIFYEKSELISYLTHCINGGDRALADLAERAWRTLMYRAPPAMGSAQYPGERPFAVHGHAYEVPMYHPADLVHTGHHTNYSHYMHANNTAPRASPVPEPMEGAGEQFPEMSCIDDTMVDNPFATVFNNTAHTSPLYSSPNATANEVMMNSPSQTQWNSMNPSSSTPPHAPGMYQRRTNAYPPDPSHHQWDEFSMSYGNSEMPYNPNSFERNRRPGVPGPDLSHNVYHTSHPPSAYYQNQQQQPLPPHHPFYNRRDQKHT